MKRRKNMETSKRTGLICMNYNPEGRSNNKKMVNKICFRWDICLCKKYWLWWTQTWGIWSNLWYCISNWSIKWAWTFTCWSWIRFTWRLSNSWYRLWKLCCTFWLWKRKWRSNSCGSYSRRSSWFSICKLHQNKNLTSMNPSYIQNCRFLYCFLKSQTLRILENDTWNWPN